MNIEIKIDEEIIKAELELALAGIIKKVIANHVSSWRFEETIKKILMPMIDDSIKSIVTEELQTLDTIKDAVRLQMIKTAKANYNKALKLLDGNENND